MSSMFHLSSFQGITKLHPAGYVPTIQRLCPRAVSERHAFMSTPVYRTNITPVCSYLCGSPPVRR
eukprot:1158335-Pelagomonas_calceolata.AAC.12